MRTADDALKLAWRPMYHWAAPVGFFMNDPNGLVLHDGVWHLFYQYYAYPGGEGIGWGHASSRDLVSWKVHPLAIQPHDNQTAASGSAIYDEHNISGLFPGGSGFLALYTNWLGLGFTGQPLGEQRQYLAYSRDGLTWTDAPGNPVIPNPGINDFRDPKIFYHQPSGRWIAVIAAWQKLMFAASRDLRNWELVGEYAQEPAHRQGAWECPDLVELDVDGDPSRRRSVLISSQLGGKIFTKENEGWIRSRYMVGDFDGKRFVPEAGAEDPLLIDHGPDCYAPVTWWTRDLGTDHRMLLGWMNNWLYAYSAPTVPLWAGVMTVPRRIALISTPAGPRLTSTPAPQLKVLRRSSHDLSPRDLAGEWTVPGCRGECLELELVLASDRAQVDLAVRVGGGRETVISWRPASRQLVLDRTHSHVVAVHRLLDTPNSTPCDAAGGELRLHVYLDRCSVEVFADGGRVVMSGVVYPDPTDVAVSLRSSGGPARLVSGRWHELALPESSGAAEAPPSVHAP